MEWITANWLLFLVIWIISGFFSLMNASDRMRRMMSSRDPEEAQMQAMEGIGCFILCNFVSSAAFILFLIAAIAKLVG